MIKSNENMESSFFESESKIFDINTKNVVKIKYEGNNKKNTILKSIEYNKPFWDSFNIDSVSSKN